MTCNHDWTVVEVYYWLTRHDTWKFRVWKKVCKKCFEEKILRIEQEPS